MESGKVYAGLQGRLASEYGHLSVKQTAEWLGKNAKEDATIIIMHSHENLDSRAAFHQFKNVHYPTPQGHLNIKIGVEDACPF